MKRLLHKNQHTQISIFFQNFGHEKSTELTGTSGTYFNAGPAILLGTGKTHYRAESHLNLKYINTF